MDHYLILKGEVIGINTAIIAPGQSGSIGIGFAIPANAASNVIDQLIDLVKQEEVG